MITEEMIAYESGSSREEARWERWVNEVERLLGHSLDGDQEIDGYSLDGALDLFKSGMKPITYAFTVSLNTATAAPKGMKDVD